MPQPLFKMPNSKDEFLLFVLANNKFNSLVAGMRWVYDRASYNTSNETVNRRMAVWIRNNWNWLIKDFEIKDGKITFEFAVQGVVTGNAWSVEIKSPIEQERNLYLFVRDLYDIQSV